LFGGSTNQIPQNEFTPFRPRSPYGCAKLYAHSLVVNYREAYGMFAVNGILFNHESPRRGENFVTRKISRSVAEIKLGRREYLELGNLNSRRDWGHARDYVEAIWLMLQQARPRDFVISNDESHSVREFVELAFEVIGVNISWSGEGLREVGCDSSNGKLRVRVSEKFFRPSEVDHLLGDSSLARKYLAWQPKTSFKALVQEMVLSDINLLSHNPDG
jgi:GDPmannose 4,6-dehydratase